MSTVLRKRYDVTKEPIPLVPAQHYFMGGVKVNMKSKTTMNNLYAAGETSVTAYMVPTAQQLTS